MARYGKTIDLLLEYIDSPTASYTLSFVSSCIHTIRHSFLSANRMVTLLLSVLSFRALISSSDKTFLIPLLSA